MARTDDDDARDIPKYWAGSHIVIAILQSGVSSVQWVRIALYVSVLAMLALAFEYVFGPMRVVKVR